VETRQQILVFTDRSLHAMQFLGPPFTFGINLISENITIASPLAAIAVDDSVYWMGREEFYVYTGQVQKLPCSVRSYVFEDFNSEQITKVTSGVNSSFSEIWWFYPSANSVSLDKYVIFNYQENVWYYGNIPRTAWLDRGISQYPIAASTDGFLYYQEFGQDDGSQSPPVAVDSYIESSPTAMGAGDDFVFIRRLIPDITFVGSSSEAPSVNMTIETKNFPGSNYSMTSVSPVSRTATVPIEQFTQQAHIRLRGRSFAFKISSDTTGVDWRLGTPRIDARGDGRR
jgi:hypothetical protein